MKVQCVNNEHLEHVLTIGSVYEVIQSNSLGDEYLILADDNRVWRCHVARFEIIQ